MIDAALETVFGAGVGGASAGAVVDVWGGLKFGLRVTCVRDRRRLPDKSSNSANVLAEIVRCRLDRNSKGTLKPFMPSHFGERLPRVTQGTIQCLKVSPETLAAAEGVPCADSDLGSKACVADA